MEVEARMVGLAIREPKHTIPTALSMGLDWSDFRNKEHRDIYKEILEMWSSGIAIDGTVLSTRLPKLASYINDLSQVTGEIDVKTYTSIILEDSIKRAQKSLGARLSSMTDGNDVPTTLSEVQAQIDRLSSRYSRMKSPLIQNPADVLDVGKGWSTSTGMVFIDRLTRLTSGGIHFLAGDPGAGKTTMVVHMLAHNAANGINSVGILAESSQLEVSLAMLTQKRAISAYYASQIRFNPDFRTQARIDMIRELWDEHFGKLPLQIHSVTQGPEEVISLVNSITEPSLVCIDHAVAVIAQGQLSGEIKEYQNFNRLFSHIHNAAERNDHVVVMANQYTKEGRKGETRDGDAQFGGSGVRNIASTMIHLMQPHSEISTAVGYRMMKGSIPKCRAMLIADEHGVTIDPVQLTQESPFTYYINTRYRLVTDQIPIA